MSSLPIAQLPLAPLGPGDLIDRAVRLYRRHLFTLIRIAAPPVIVTAVGSVLWTIAWRQLFLAASNQLLALYVLLGATGAVLIAGGHIFNLLVMGGAARNLVTHLLWNEPVSARATYGAVRSRFWPLLGATLVVVFWAGLALSIAFFSWYIVLIIIGLGAVVLAQTVPVWVSALVGVTGFIGATAVALWLFFLVVGRIAYVPQVVLVEGKRVFEAIGRSFALAKGNVRRLMAMTLFVIFATYSALMILVVPLGWYAYLSGIDPSPWKATDWPAWYAISYSVLEPLSSILLAPVWMLGLSLLYVDERVRHEGYDIELMASRQMEQLPKLDVSSPFAPAISVDPRTIASPSLSSNTLRLS